MQPSPDTSAPSILILPSIAVALAGVDTPLGGLSINGPDTDDVAIVINAAIGTLSAATFPGATVSGGGTGSLWLAGSPAQVNAKLATLVYAGPNAGADTLTVSLVDSSGQTSPPTVLPLIVVPLITGAGPLSSPVAITGGTLTLDTRQIDGVTLDIHDAGTGSGAATLVLADSSLGPDTTLDVASGSPAGPAPRVAIAGNVVSNGTTKFNAGPALVTLAQNGVLINSGQIAFNDSSAQVTGTGTLQNDGTIAISATTVGSGPAIDVAITGSGVISLGPDADLTLGTAVASSQTIRFEDNSGTLELDAPQTMQATIEGFVAGDKIQLGELQTDASDYTQTATGGTLILYDGPQVAVSLHFEGVHQLSDFTVSVKTDSASDGGAITTLSVLSSLQTAVAVSDSTAAIYRFFDSATGTQFLTQDSNELHSILSTRPDLKFEGVAMGALASPATDPDTIPVYRFFDTLDGTHFFTASAAEKDGLLASRPDLVFEPSSSIWEHATQQAGDAPVFRFFDTATGSHFYTSSAAERASILATRTDLKAEGVAFYAPAQ